MFKTIINNGHYIFPENFSLDFPCQIDVCRFSDPTENHYRVLLLTTESSLSPNRVKAKDILSHEHKYDLILDHDVDVLSSCDNSLKFLYGSTWLNRGKINHPENTSIIVKGRHDPCVGIRAVPIGEAMMNCILLDHYLMNKAQCS